MAVAVRCAAARKRISEAAKKRWAERRRAAAPAKQALATKKQPKTLRNCPCPSYECRSEKTDFSSGEEEVGCKESRCQNGVTHSGAIIQGAALGKSS